MLKTPQLHGNSAAKPPGTVTLVALDEPVSWLPAQGQWLCGARTGYEIVAVHVVKTRDPMPPGRHRLKFHCVRHPLHDVPNGARVFKWWFARRKARR